jgi:hypothetical protein
MRSGFFVGFVLVYILAVSWYIFDNGDVAKMKYTPPVHSLTDDGYGTEYDLGLESEDFGYWSYESKTGKVVFSISKTDSEEGTIALYAYGNFKKFSEMCPPGQKIELKPLHTCAYTVGRDRYVLWWYNKELGDGSHVILVVGEQ